MYKIGDVVTINTEDYPLLSKETVELFRQLEGKPLKVEHKFLSSKKDIWYYHLSHEGEVVKNGDISFPFIDADLRPWKKERRVHYVRSDVTVEELPDGRAVYNYQGTHERYFASFEDAMRWVNGEIDDEAIVDESGDDTFIVYCDFTHNAVVAIEVDRLELQEEFDGDIEAYADEKAPSNTCNYFVVDDRTKFICDAKLVDVIASRREDW